MSTTTATWRKTKQGQWVAFGPVGLVQTGKTAAISTRDGKVACYTVASVGKTFQVDGVACRYGYLDRERKPASNGTGGICDECQRSRRNLRQCSDSSGLVGRCCPQCASMSPFERSFA